MESTGAVDLAALSAEVAIEARQLIEDGRWSDERERALDEAFDQAAREALRQASFDERSVHIRAIARRVIPCRLRPFVVRIVRFANGSRRRV